MHPDDPAVRRRALVTRYPDSPVGPFTLALAPPHGARGRPSTRLRAGRRRHARPRRSAALRRRLGVSGGARRGDAARATTIGSTAVVSQRRRARPRRRARRTRSRSRAATSSTSDSVTLARARRRRATRRRHLIQVDPHYTLHAPSAGGPASRGSRPRPGTPTGWPCRTRSRPASPRATPTCRGFAS